MIVFGWMIAFAVLVAAVVVLLSLPAAYRTIRGRGQVRFSWVPLSVALLVAGILAATVIAAALLTGTVD